MTKVYLVRHGETDWNALRRIQGREDIPLNKNGKKQAMECGVYLKDHQFDYLISSPMTRAKQTATLINEHLGFEEIIEMEAFMERDYGEVSGQIIDDKLREILDKEHPTIESWDALKERVMRGLQIIHEKYPNKSILLVAHGGVINAVLGSLSNGEIGSGKTKLMNGSISTIHFRDDLWNLNDYNLVLHLS